MKKAILLAAAVLGLMLLGSPRSEACHTHGYVRASTLHDLFQGSGDSQIQFSAGGETGSQLSNGDGGLNLASYDSETGFGDHTGGDGHSFGWSLDGGKTFNNVGAGDAAYDVGTLMGDIELAIDAHFDNNYAD